MERDRRKEDEPPFSHPHPSFLGTAPRQAPLQAAQALVAGLCDILREGQIPSHVRVDFGDADHKPIPAPQPEPPRDDSDGDGDADDGRGKGEM